VLILGYSAYASYAGLPQFRLHEMADSNIVSITKLDNQNYQSWKFKVRMLLIREGTRKCVQEALPIDRSDE